MLSEINGDIINTIIQGETIKEMKRIADGSVDMILADLPYGTTACKWDTIIPFEPLWAEYERIIKPNGAIVLTASQPFTSALVMSNPNIFKYDLVWDKRNVTGHLMAKRMPMRQHESILVFYKKQPAYNPQFEYLDVNDVRYSAKGRIRKSKNDTAYGDIKGGRTKETGRRYPKSIISYNNSNHGGKVHPTQKPVALFEYIIRTYTNEGELVLDNVIGSGTTAVAAINTGRQFIGIEREEEYVNIARERVKQAYAERAKTEVMSND